MRSVLTLEDRTAWEKHRGLTVQGDRGTCDKMGDNQQPVEGEVLSRKGGEVSFVVERKGKPH